MAEVTERDGFKMSSEKNLHYGSHDGSLPASSSSSVREVVTRYDQMLQEQIQGHRDKEHPSDRALTKVDPAHLLNIQQCDERVRSEDPVDMKDMKDRYEVVSKEIRSIRYRGDISRQGKCRDSLRSDYGSAESLTDPLKYDIPSIDSHSKDSPQKVSFDDEESVNNLIDSLESFEKKLKTEPIPGKVEEKIKSLCKDYNVRYPIWSQSPFNCNRISILGVGATRIQNQLEEMCPDFEFETVESGPLHIEQYSSFHVREKVIRDNHIQWEHSSSTACELILEGEEMDKEHPSDRALYAAVPAHLILSDQQCNEVADFPDDIERIRRDVNSQVDRTRYLLEFRPTTEHIDVKHPALISYRHYYDGTAEKEGPGTQSYRCSAGKCTLKYPSKHREERPRKKTECPHHFINDIAILCIDHHNFERFREAIQDHESFQLICYERVVAITTYDQIVQFWEKNKVLYMRGLRCHPMQCYSGSIDDASHRLPFYLRFFMEDPQNTLEPGDSGAIIYAEDKKQKKYPIAMLIGKFKSSDASGPNHQPTYKAIILSQALRDIEIAYPHRVANLSVANLLPLQ